MRRNLELIRNVQSPIALIVCAGFEERAPRAATLLEQMGIRPSSILLLTYEGDAHEESYRKLSAACKRLLGPSSRPLEVRALDFAEINRFLFQIEAADLVVCDITGLSRITMFAILTQLRIAERRFWLLYTEAHEYYPRFSDFEQLLNEDLSEAFFDLVEYEDAELVYSANCRAEEIPHFEGIHLPNYPLMLVAFLTFKRSRLSSVLREYEANIRVLVKSVPVRPELAWREKAMEIINFDLIEENRASIFRVQTLDWQETYKFLNHLYADGNNRYRFNFLLAPLGSKMQTVGAWAFAIENPSVRVVTSTPSKLFPQKYSIGFGDTFLIDDLPQLVHNH